MGVRASVEVCPWHTEEAPPTQTSSVLASWSFPAAESEVQSGVRGERRGWSVLRGGLER